jgi:hypothetical protein
MAASRGAGGKADVIGVGRFPASPVPVGAGADLRALHDGQPFSAAIRCTLDVPAGDGRRRHPVEQTVGPSYPPSGPYAGKFRKHSRSGSTIARMFEGNLSDPGLLKAGNAINSLA